MNQYLVILLCFLFKVQSFAQWGASPVEPPVENEETVVEEPLNEPVVEQQKPIPEKPLILIWPATPRPKLDAKIEKVELDGFTFDRFILSNSDDTFEMPPVTGFLRDSFSPRESFAMSNQLTGERISFARFTNKEFLPDFSWKSLQAYAAGLKLEYGKTLTLLNEEDQFEVKHTFFIMGAPYRRVDYKIQKADKSYQFVHDYLTFLDKENGGLLIIRHTGSENAFKLGVPILIQSLQQSVLRK